MPPSQQLTSLLSKRNVFGVVAALFCLVFYTITITSSKEALSATHATYVPSNPGQLSTSHLNNQGPNEEGGRVGGEVGGEGYATLNVTENVSNQDQSEVQGGTETYQGADEKGYVALSEKAKLPNQIQGEGT